MAVLEGYLMPHPPVLVPEVGQGRERVCKATIDAMNEIGIRISEIKPKTIIIISPHGPVFSDGIALNGMETMIGSLKQFGSEEVKLSKSNDLELLNEIILSATMKGIVTAKVDSRFARQRGISTELDHGALVPLYFAEKEYANAQLVHITYGLLSRVQLYSFGMSISEAVEKLNREVVVIASGDLSHCLSNQGPYDYHPMGSEFDHELIQYLSKADFLNVLKMPETMVNDAGECGYRSLNIMAGMFDGLEIKAYPKSYEGPFGVGYGVVEFRVEGENTHNKLLTPLTQHRNDMINKIRSKEDHYVRLARSTIEEFVKQGKKSKLTSDLPKEMLNQTAGVFVSIKSNGGLRGCIGTTMPTTSSVAQEIIENAIKAATEDPRFSPIEPNELDDLIINVDILMPSEKIDSKEELDIKEFGLIVTSGYKRGLLLPNIDGVNTIDEQIKIALNKAGIKDDETFGMERFKVVRHT